MTPFSIDIIENVRRFYSRWAKTLEYKKSFVAMNKGQDLVSIAEEGLESYYDTLSKEL